MYHLVKQRPGILEEVVWTIKLLHFAITHHLKEPLHSYNLTDNGKTHYCHVYQYPVRVHDSVEPVSNGHNSALREVLSDCLLDNFIGAVLNCDVKIWLQSSCYFTHLISTLAVASSNTRILFFLSRALARHTSCL